MTAKTSSKKSQAKKAEKPEEQAAPPPAEKAAVEKPAKSWEHADVPAAELILESDLQMRAQTHDPADYLEILEENEGRWVFPPVRACIVRGRLLVVDGFTRTQAAQLYAEKHAPAQGTFYLVPALIRKSTLKEAIAEALGANAEHGYRRTNADKRHAVLRALAEFPGKSLEKIAAMCRVSHTYVYKLRAQLSQPEKQAEDLSPEEVQQATAEHAQAQEADAQAEKLAAALAASGSAVKLATEKLGPCPACGQEVWQEGDDGYTCGHCLHPWGESAGHSGDEAETAAQFGSMPPLPAGAETLDRPPSEAVLTGGVDLHRKGLDECSSDLGSLVRSLHRVKLYDRLESALNSISQAILQERSKCPTRPKP